MIVSIGTDLVDIPRLAAVMKARGRRFEQRIYTPGEIAYCRRRKASAMNSFAGRFAAKEAVMKALGTGWTQKVRWVDIEVVRETGGPPKIQLRGESAKIAKRKGIKRLHLSITHSETSAIAFVVAEG